MLTFDFEKSNFGRLYIQIWFEFWRNEYGFIFGSSELMRKVKEVKSQNFEFDLNVELLYCP